MDRTAWLQAADTVRAEMELHTDSVRKGRVPRDPERTNRLERELRHCENMADAAGRRRRFYAR